MDMKKIKVSVKPQDSTNKNRDWILKELDKYPRYGPKQDPAIKRLNERFAEIDRQYSNKGCLGVVIFTIMITGGLPLLYLFIG